MAELGSRELRLAFAMGGGVSLGTFNGAALTEALKLAVLYGVYQDGPGGPVKSYRRVVVDVFSGASAGAMSLGIMLRGLTFQTPQQITAAEARVRVQHPGAEARLQAIHGAAWKSRWEELVAAQVTQDAQEAIWCREITLAGMLGRGTGRSLEYVGSVLDRRGVDAIAARWLRFYATTPGSPTILPRIAPRLLGQRVLYACTLSSLAPMVADARREFERNGDPGGTGFIGLRDGLTSQVRRDVRVFDLMYSGLDDALFDEDDAVSDRLRQDFPDRWVRYHAGPRRSGRIGSLLDERAWAKISATAIASGAFPFAFEPVVLSRARYEMGPLWDAERFRDGPGGAEWSAYPYTYIDGGAFNNEPIREAFRLASFIDAQSRDPDGADRTADFDRRVIMVDPNVNADELSMRVPLHRAFRLVKEDRLGRLDGTTLERLASLDRVATGVGGVVGAVLNEARGVEGDKVFGVRRQFEVRAQLRAAIAAFNAGAPTEDSFEALAAMCDEAFGRLKMSADIPASGVSLTSELWRVIHEDAALLAEISAAEPGGGVVPVREQVAAFVERRLSKTMAGVGAKAKAWLRALSYIALDIAMGLTAKWKDARLLCVFPAEFGADGTVEILDLPGGAIEGFAGFMSGELRPYEARIARRCARVFLAQSGMISAVDADADPKPNVVWTPDEKARFDRDIEAGCRMLGDRLKQMVRQSRMFEIFPVIEQIAETIVNGKIEKAVAGLAVIRPRIRRFEFRVRVQRSDLEIDGRGDGLNDAEAARYDGSNVWTIVTFADDVEIDGQRYWHGPHVQELPGGRRGFVVDVNNALSGHFCTLRMPTAAAIAAADRWPNPIFTAELIASDSGKDLGPERWAVAAPAPRSPHADERWRPGDGGPGVMPLDESIFASG